MVKVRPGWQGSVFDKAAAAERRSMHATNPRPEGPSFMKRHLDPHEGIFRESAEGRNINNLWSGYELGGTGNLLVGGSILGGGSLIAANPRGYQNFYNRSNILAESEAMDIESMPGTRGDLQGYQSTLGVPASNYLQSSGDLVFALHKTRHSGQL